MQRRSTRFAEAAVSTSNKNEDCPICYETFGSDKANWNVLHCDHKMCATCYKQIEITGTTMSGLNHTSVKCPFCQIITGVMVGTCPDGTMKVTILKSPCEGYEGFDTIQIHYHINDGSYYLSRVAYLPHNEEGKEILELLRIAWDRRIAFTIGTSVTTGRENTVVWNIHHKTSQTDGVAHFGYPDPTDFQHVKWELEANGIALNAIGE